MKPTDRGIGQELLGLEDAGPSELHHPDLLCPIAQRAVELAERGVDLVAPRAAVRAVGVPLLVLRLEVRERPARARDVGAAVGHRQPPQVGLCIGDVRRRRLARDGEAVGRAVEGAHARYARREESRELAGAAAGVDDVEMRL